MRPLMRRREGLPWLIGNERVDMAGIAIAPAPPVAPVGSSKHPGAPEGDNSPSAGVTLQQKHRKSMKSQEIVSKESVGLSFTFIKSTLFLEM